MASTRYSSLTTTLLFLLGTVSSLSFIKKSPGRTWWHENLTQGYRNRLAADPDFLLKSSLEVVLAASTQLAAEWNTRGGMENLVVQMDFVVPALLSAVAGKYISMWKTAPTLSAKNQNNRPQQQQKDTMFAGLAVPTNAFQNTMMDGYTRPHIRQRLASLLVSVLPLFRAGCIASGLGYGATALAIKVRTWCFPDYVAATRTINVVYASLYTGVFMAVVSNIRYQVLQGVVEPFIRGAFCSRRKRRIAMLLERLLIFWVRVGNGFLGSSLAIAGMQLCGFQRMK